MVKGQHKMMRSALVALGFLLSTCLSAAEALEPATASALVTATTSGIACPISSGLVADKRVSSSGTITALTIPTGSVLVITAFEWQAEVSGPPLPAVGTVVLKLETASTSASVATSTATFTATSVTTGLGGASVQIPNGVVLKPGRKICVDPLFSFTSLLGTVHGFFTVDQ